MSKIHYPYLPCLAEVTIGFNPTYSVGEDVGNVSVTVSLFSGILGRDVIVSLRTMNGMAVGELLIKHACLIIGCVGQLQRLKYVVISLNAAGMDFVNVSLDLTFSASSTTQTVMVTILDDTAPEHMLEYFSFVLMSTNPAVAFNPMITNITIIDNSDSK